MSRIKPSRGSSFLQIDLEKLDVMFIFSGIIFYCHAKIA